MRSVIKLAVVAAAALSGSQAFACGKTGDYTAIWEIQGSGESSPLVNTTVNKVRGIVTANFEQGSGGPYEARGFYIQAQESDCDAATSDGLLVFTNTSKKNVIPGTLVEISNAKVTEYKGPASFIWDRTMTELTCTSASCTVTTVQANAGIPAAEEYTPPTDAVAAQTYNEAHEGMLMKVSADTTAVTPADVHDEVGVLRGTNRERLYYTTKSAQGELIFVNGDDMSAAKCGADGLPAMKTFDVVRFDSANGKQIYGPLNYGFNTYKIQQDASHSCIGFTAGSDASYSPETNLAPNSDSNIMTIATYNLHNFFDNVDDPAKTDTVQTLAAYQAQSKKHAKAICAAAGLNKAEVIGLEEVENDVVLTQLVADIQSECGVTYQFNTFAGPDDRSIQVGALTRSDRVKVMSATARQSCSAVNWGINYEAGDFPADVTCPADKPYFLFPRPPLQLELQVTKAGKVQNVSVFMNHFKSKLTSDACSIGDCTDHRIEEAKQITAWVKDKLVTNPKAAILVMGDLNDFDQSEPLNELNKTRGVMTNLWSLLSLGDGTQGSNRRYGYTYQGAAQMLDHILVSDGFLDLHPVISPRHINNDYPGSLANATGYYGTSDHDPLMASVDFSAQKVDQAPIISIAQPSSNASVSGTVTVQLAASDAEDILGSLLVSVAIDSGAFQTAHYNSTAGRYEWSWNATASGVGIHAVKAKVRDSAGHEVLATTVNVNVSSASCPTGYTRLTGKLNSTGAVDSLPGVNGYYQSTISGAHNGILHGPASADFDLYFWKWTGSSWKVVARSISDISNETVNYSGTAGYYGWTVESYRGTGDYEFCYKKP